MASEQTLRFFDDPAWENMALAEIEDRRNSARIASSQVTPDLARNVADLSFVYPKLSGGVVTGMALAGVAPLSDDANYIDRRNAELEAAGIATAPDRVGFWDAGLGRAFKGFTRGTFTFFQSLYDEAIKGSASWLYGIGQGMSPGDAAAGSFGFSPGAIAAAQLLKGQDVDLGEGFFAGGRTTEIGLQAQAQRGVRLAGTEDLVDDRFAETPGARGGLTVTPGRVVASTVTEPGTTSFGLFSGALDFASNIFLDPANKAGGWVGDWRRANKALIGGGARKSVLARPVDDWLASRHGENVAEFIAKTDDYYTLHGLFRKNAKESNVDARFIEALRSTTDTTQVKTLLSEAAKGAGGGAGVLTELPVRQGIIGRPFGTSGLAGIVARGLGQSGGTVDVLGLRQAIKVNRESSTWLGRMSAEVGATMLRVEDVSGSVDDFGQWLQAAGFAPERIGHYMSQMAQLKSGGIETGAAMYGIVKGATKEFGEQLVKEGIPAPVAKAFTSMFDTVEDYRKYWTDNMGNPMLFPGGRYTVMMNGQVRALPAAHLFTEFLDWTVPLADMRRMRKALSRKMWAKAGFGELAGKTVKTQVVPGRLIPDFSIENMTNWNDLGPGVANRLMGNFMQRFWKPLVLMRVAWPVRVIGEEQARLAAMGLDSVYNHPIHGLAMMLSRSTREGYLAIDAKGGAIAEAAQHSAAMSRRGGALGGGKRASLYSNEWVRAAKDNPRYWEGLAIEIQQLADDPIASRIAQAIIDGGEGAEFAQLLKPIKDAFWEGGELDHLRKTLARDGQRWEILTVREAADGYIDSVFGRIVHKAGGDVVWADHLKGNWHDMYGNQLQKVEGTQFTFSNPATGAHYELSKPPRQAISITREGLSGDLATQRRDLDPFFSEVSRVIRNPELGLARDERDLDLIFDQLQTMDSIIVGSSEHPRQWETLRQTMGVQTPQELDDLIARNADALLAGEPSVTREVATELARVQGFLDEINSALYKEQGLVGNANWRALDMIEASGNPDLVRRRFAGYEPQPGMPTLEELANKTTWTPQEIRAAIASDMRLSERFPQMRVPPHISDRGKQIWTELGPNNTETISVAHDGVVTGYINLQRRADGSVENVIMFATAKGLRHDTAAGRLVTPRADEAEKYAGSVYREDAFDMIAYAMGRSDLDPSDVAELVFNGVPVREWLNSAGQVMVRNADGTERPAMSVGEMIEAIRLQHGSAWAGRNTGPLGQLPSIELSNDGAGALARFMIWLQDTEGHARQINRMAENMVALGDEGAAARIIERNPMSWAAKNQHYQAVGAPDMDLIAAIASSKLGENLDISAMNLLDEPEKISRITDISRTLKETFEADPARLARLPESTKVALKADATAGQRWDKVIDHLFDFLMSRPTNALSRSPAFKQFYWRRMTEMVPYMDDASRATMLKNAKAAGIGRGDLRSMVKAAFLGDDVTEVALEAMTKDFAKGRFKGAAGQLSLDDADEIAKAFSLEETKRLLYDTTKRTNFFDATRNIFPFGEAWLEIISTWMRLVGENPNLVRRFQQGIEGARNTGFFYPDPSTGEEVFAFPLGELWLNNPITGETFPDANQGDTVSAHPVFTGRVEGLNLALNSFLPGLGPLVQMPMASIGKDLLDKPEFRWARNLVFPFGYPDTESPGQLVDSLMPAWFTKALIGFANPSGDDERLYNNTVIDVLRAMQINGEIPQQQTPAEAAAMLEEARKRARKVYQFRALSQFAGPTGAGVRWDVEVDPDGTAFAYQVLATEYRQLIESHSGDRVQAFYDFVNTFGFDPAGIATAKTEQIRPRSVTEEGLDFQALNPQLFEDFKLTAYYVAPDPVDGEFDYNAYLAQIRTGDRISLTPEQWETERNRLLGSVAYEKVRRQAQSAGVRNDPRVVAYLRTLRYSLMDTYPGYGFENIGVGAQADRELFMREFDSWRESEQMMATPAGQGLGRYLQARDRALAVASSEYGVSEGGFANSTQAVGLKAYLLTVGEGISREFPDFAVIFQRHYAWEVEDPEPVSESVLLGVDLATAEED